MRFGCGEMARDLIFGQSRLSPVTATVGGSIVVCRVVPSASKSCVASINQGELKVRVAAPPVDGKANAELTRFLAKLFGVSKSSVQILKGETGKRKKLFVGGLGPEEILKKLEKEGQ